MVLSKREKYIGIGTVAAVALLILNSVILDPLLAEQHDLDFKIDKATAEKKSDDDLLELAAKKSKSWNFMLNNGLLRDESKATSQLYNNISIWSRDAGLNPPPALKSDRASEKDKDFQKISVHASITGSMSQIGRFLWDIQTAGVPARVTDLQINSRKDGMDDLKVEMDIATIFFNPPPVQSDSNSAAPVTPAASDNWEVHP